MYIRVMKEITQQIKPGKLVLYNAENIQDLIIFLKSCFQIFMTGNVGMFHDLDKSGSNHLWLRQRPLYSLTVWHLRPWCLTLQEIWFCQLTLLSPSGNTIHLPYKGLIPCSTDASPTPLVELMKRHISQIQPVGPLHATCTMHWFRKRNVVEVEQVYKLFLRNISKYFLLGGKAS